jgi:membrane protein implicated in regulation of membrane protease activity
VHRPDQGPGTLAWLLGLVSAVLPWAGGALALAGIWLLARQQPVGWWYLAAGGLLVAADVLIGLLWSRPSVLKTDQPDLNRRPEQFVGRVVVVEEAIARGRGKVRVGDTLWPAEGPDLPAGAHVRVTAARGSVLAVEPVPGRTNRGAPLEED